MDLLKFTVFLHMSYDVVMQCQSFTWALLNVFHRCSFCVFFCFALVSRYLTMPEVFFCPIPWHHIFQEVECSPAPYRVVATVFMDWMCLVPLYWSTWREMLADRF